MPQILIAMKEIAKLSYIPLTTKAEGLTADGESTGW